MRRASLPVTAAACLAASLAASSARAADPKDRIPESNGEGMDLHLYRPAVDSKGFFSTNGTDVLGHLDFSLGLGLDYGYGLMPLRRPPAQTDFLQEHGFQGTANFTLGIANIFAIGLTAPVLLSNGQAVDELGPTGAVYASPAYQLQTIGTIALHVKARLLPPEKGFGIALLGQAGYGIDGMRKLGQEPGFWYWPQVAFEARALDQGKLRFGWNAGFRGHTGADPRLGLASDGQPQLARGVFEYGQLVTANFAVSIRAAEPIDLIAETYGTYLVGGGANDEQRPSAEAIGGIKLFIEKRSFFSLAGGAGYAPGFQSALARVAATFVFEPSIGDRDGDGIKDDQDDCPDDPEDFDGFQDTKADSPKGKYGCPDPDNDNDGIPDKKDRCPNVAEDFDGDHDEDGCPEGGDGDKDGDGILDRFDKCPNDPEDKDGFEDRDGCPDPDNDKDGIPDDKDGPGGSCKNEPEDKDGFEDDDGCPDPDNDKDGILDDVDGPGGSCKNDPETFNGFEDEDGCPDQGKVIIQDNSVIILEKIQFETGSAKILKKSDDILNALTATLKGHPEFKLLEVQGHADERGDDKLNLSLTELRAKAVLEALVKRGVDKGRLRSQGYGEYCPLDPAKSAAAYEKNRRVEFKVLKTDTGNTGVELGCEAARAKGIKPAPP